MSKALYKAAALEARLAELAGPEWASDDEAGAAAGLGGKTTKDFVAVDGAAKKKQKGKERKSAKGAPAASSGVVYLGHIPHGFYEDQMRGFFSQFGDIVRLRLSRSKKTAKSRGYAFVEFESKEVAGIVAETMNGYYLEGRKLVCHVMDPKDIHERLFDGANRTFQKISWRKLERERVNKPKTEEGIKKCTDRRLSSESKKRQRLAELGIDYDFPGLAGALKEAGEAGEEKEEKVERPKKRAATGEIKPAAKKPATASTTQAAAKPAEGEKEEGKAGKAKKRPRQEEEAKPEEQEEEAEKPKVVKKVKGKAAAPAEPAAKKQPAAEAKPSGAVKEKPAAKAKKAAAAAPPAKKGAMATKTTAKTGAAGGKTKPAKKAGSK